jgi:hypothetical protein
MMLYHKDMMLYALALAAAVFFPGGALLAFHAYLILNNQSALLTSRCCCSSLALLSLRLLSVSQSPFRAPAHALSWALFHTPPLIPLLTLQDSPVNALLRIHLRAFLLSFLNTSLQKRLHILTHVSIRHH